MAIIDENSRGWVVAPSYELASKIGREINENRILKYKFPTTNKRVINGQLFYAKFINNAEFIKTVAVTAGCFVLSKNGRC